ncbi:neuropeptide CCHamide-1 receptor-like [Periplaneta americana]|uniref:neuropeptide CCHamide-1 receptor-like n=1 Tax=Periplaneta americana TaxID=6978 RepID=UPI0037E7F6D4
MEVIDDTTDFSSVMDEVNITLTPSYERTVNSSNTTTEIPYVDYSERPETYIVPVLFAIIFVVGVLGNGTLVLIFIRHRNMRNVPNTYIFSLALGDLLVIVTCVPFTSTVYTVDSWPYGELICKLSECVKDISIGVSVFTLTALSADRFFAIVDPMRKLHTGGGGRRATRFTISIAVLIWILAIIFALPAAIASYIRVFKLSDDKSFNVCYPFRVSWGEKYAEVMVIAKFVIYYAVPLVVISFFYLLMARHLILSTRNMPGEMQGQARQVRARKKVAKMVLAFVIVFAVCFFPQHVFMLWFYSDQEAAAQQFNGFWHAFRIIGFCLSFINSCINPIALYCVSGTFRKHFNRYLLCICCKNATVSGRGRSVLGSNSCRTSLASRRHLGTLTSSRRYATCTKSTWESTTVAHYNNTVRKHAPLTSQPTEEISITTFMNGGLMGTGKEMHIHIEE